MASSFLLPLTVENDFSWEMISHGAGNCGGLVHSVANNDKYQMITLLHTFGEITKFTFGAQRLGNPS